MSTAKKRNRVLAWVIAAALCITMSPLISQSGTVQAEEEDYRVVALNSNNTIIPNPVVCEVGETVKIAIVDSNNKEVTDYSEWEIAWYVGGDISEEQVRYDKDTRELTAGIGNGYFECDAYKSRDDYYTDYFYVYINDGHRAYISEDGEEIWEYTMKKGEDHRFVAEIEPLIDMSKVKWTWKSGDSKVATVDNTGKVTALKSGYSEIVCESDFQNLDYYFHVFVNCYSDYIDEKSYAVFPDTKTATLAYAYGFKKLKVPAMVISEQWTDEGDEGDEPIRTTCKVTAIGYEACYGNDTLAKVTIGANIKSIGKYAFYECPKLKTVKVKSKKITKVDKNAFKKINKKVTFEVPKSKLKAYKKLFKKAGAPKTAKYKAI